jgi:hypothetical protein
MGDREDRDFDKGFSARGTHPPCELVVQHAGMLGEFKADLKYIRQKLDNGLTQKLDDMKDALEVARIATMEVKTDLEKKTAEIEAQMKIAKEKNWLPALMTSGIKKGILFIFIIVIIVALANTAMWSITKIGFFKENPGQQRLTSDFIMTEGYHPHILDGGKILIHANNPTKPAWILDPNTGKYSRAPQLRTDDDIKGGK